MTYFDKILLANSSAVPGVPYYIPEEMTCNLFPAQKKLWRVTICDAEVVNESTIEIKKNN